MQPATLGGEFEGIAHQVVEHLQQQVPVAQNPRQLGVGVKVQAHLLFIGIEPIGAEGLFDGGSQLHRFEGPDPFRFQPGEVEHVVDEPGQSIGFIVGDAQKLLFLLFCELVAQVVEGFHVALDIEQGCAQFVGDVADETALGGVQFHLAAEVLDGDGDSLKAFAGGIPH